VLGGTATRIIDLGSWSGCMISFTLRQLDAQRKIAVYDLGCGLSVSQIFLFFSSHLSSSLVFQIAASVNIIIIQHNLKNVLSSGI
jgi:hypothetical protein